MRLSEGGFSYAEIMELPADEFDEWLREAVDYQLAINKAARGK